jgi:hypothetical protein
VWHVDEGKFDNTGLDGLSVAIAAHRLKNAAWKDEGSGSFMYVDEGASDAQKAALVQIFSAKVGGVPPLLARIVSRLQGVKSAPIEYIAEGNKRLARIPGTVELEIEAMTGQDGNEVTLNNLPNWFQHSAVLAKSKRLMYHDQGLSWEISEKNGMFSPFSYVGY